MQDFPRDAQVIMAEIVGGGLLINGGMDIDYNNCNRYKEVEKKSGKGVVGECEYIAGLRAEAETNKERLKKALVEASLGPIRGIYTREVAMQVVRGELVDPLLGESLRNGKITFRGGLLAEGISKGIEYFKEKQVEKKIKDWEIRNQEERMRMEVEEITKGEQGQYEYVGEGRKVEPGMVWDALNQDNVGGVVEGGLGDSYKCTGGICIADDHGDDYGKTVGNTWGNKEGEKWSKMPVKKGDTVWGMYNNEPTNAQLEEFIKQNPYIAARGVVRDVDGNIKHLEIRAGEEISVPKDIATSHKAGYTSATNRIKDSSGDVQDVCLDPNAGDKYGNIFGAQDAAYRCVEGICSNSVLQLASYKATQENKIEALSYEEFAKTVRKDLRIEKGDVGGNDYINEKYNEYKNHGNTEISKFGVQMHKGGFLIEKFKKDNPNLSGEIKLFVDNTGKIAGVIVDTTAYILNPLKPVWEVYRDTVNDYLVPDIVKEWMNDKAGKVEEGLKSWEKGLTSKQKVILETLIDGVKFGGDIAIVGSTTKLTYTVLDGGVKKVFTKPDDVNVKPSAGADVDLKKEFHSKTGDTLKSDMAFAESILKDKAIFLDEFDFYTPGPLNKGYRETFLGFRYKDYVLEKDITVYRAGAKNLPIGDYFSFDNPISEIQVRMDKAIKHVWPTGKLSVIDIVQEVKIPKGTHIYVGTVANQKDFYFGGTHQIVIPQAKEIRGVQVINSHSIIK